MYEVLRRDEEIILTLRGLYEQYGYRKYKMNKFEHYDLYQENKSFLSGDRIITFPDTHGKLLALKPDITLSIVRNASEELSSAQKVYYCENVYRSSANEDIKELLQLGIEYIGDIDMYAESEVLSLAARSLEAISPSSVLCVSHMGFIGGLLDEAGVSPSVRGEISHCISEKNCHSLKEVCEKAGVSERDTSRLVKLTSIYGPFEAALPEAKRLAGCGAACSAAEELSQLYTILSSTVDTTKLVLDFSVTNDMDYYNGVIFQGFVDGIPTGVLSGGRYDSLMRRLMKKSGAVGFAVYTDVLERLYGSGKKQAAVDVLLVYGDSDPAEVFARVASLTAAGMSVCAVKHDDNTVSAGETVRMN